MARACVRNHAFFVAMAEELGEWWMRTIADAELGSVSDWRRIERSHMEDAAEELLRAIVDMPAPLREVLVQRAAYGKSWRDVSSALPHRVYFSVVEDWHRALSWLWDRHGDLIRRIV